MPECSAVMNELIALSRGLGDPTRDLAMLGEGNTSARVDEDTVYIKASGKELRTADENTFVAVSMQRALSTLNGPDIDDTQVRDALKQSRIDPTGDVMPSVETFLHCYLLSLPGIQFVGHTHPTAVNAILCSKIAREAVSGKMFPDEIVCCGPAVCFIEYTDPGIVLAKALRTAVEAFIDEHNMPPKVIVMQNHGLICPGKSVRDVENATLMYEKTARVLIGAYTLGGPNFLSAANVARIHTRPDEHYRQKQLGG